MNSHAGKIQEAVAALRAGELVVMPTETVYGLAGDARNSAAIQKIFRAKARPDWNPLIVHIADEQDAGAVADVERLGFRALAQAFWPGPLAMVLPKRDLISELVTAGRDTVALRVPAHPVALALLREFGGPIAAPSANLFTQLSPTRIDDLSSTIKDAAAVILDGGACQVGLESTVLDMSVPEPTILRHGMVRKDQIEEVLGREIAVGAKDRSDAPGQHPRHYAPQTPIRIVKQLEGHAGLGFGPPENPAALQMPLDPTGYAQVLYRSLAALDRMGLDAIFVESVPLEPDWDAIRDRLIRASFSAGM